MLATSASSMFTTRGRRRTQDERESTGASVFGAPVDPNLVATELRAVGAEMANRVSSRLPGLGEAFERRVVVVADADHLVGVLGSYMASAWVISGVPFDTLTLNIRHAAHQDADPVVYAKKVVTTLAHEIAHAYTHVAGLVGTSGVTRARHTEDFADVARLIGLRIVRQPHHPTVIFTPGLTPHGQREFADLISRVAQLRLAWTRGVGLAGPSGFTGVLAPPKAPLVAASVFDTPASGAGSARARKGWS